MFRQSRYVGVISIAASTHYVLHETWRRAFLFLEGTKTRGQVTRMWKYPKHDMCDAACLGWASGTLHASREKKGQPQQEAGDDVI